LIIYYGAIFTFEAKQHKEKSVKDSIKDVLKEHLGTETNTFQSYVVN